MVFRQNTENVNWFLLSAYDNVWIEKDKLKRTAKLKTSAKI